MKTTLFWLTLATIIWVTTACEKRTPTPTVSVVDKNVTISSKSVVDLALENLGKPYVYGKTGPDSFDCSGFVYGIHKQLGIILPRTSYNQSEIKGEKLERNALQKGDLVFFDTSGGGQVNHSGIYLGKSEFIHASSGKAMGVTISSLDAWYKDKFKWGKRVHATK